MILLYYRKINCKFTGDTAILDGQAILAPSQLT